MYTHVGTVPRSQSRRKGGENLKEQKKKEEEGASGGQSQRKAGEHVRDSPLLSALSSHSLTSLDRPVPVCAPARPLPATPLLSRASPLTSAPKSCLNDPSADSIRSQEALSWSQGALETDKPVTEPSNMATNAPKVSSSQDVYVPMDPIAEAAHAHLKDDLIQRQRGVTSKQEASKTLNGLHENESTDRWESSFIRLSEDVVTVQDIDSLVLQPALQTSIQRASLVGF